MEKITKDNVIPPQILSLVAGSGPSDWHQHANGGGFVYKTSRVEESVFVSGDAQVYGNAQLSGNVRVYGNAQLSGNARVSGDVRVSGAARVYGNAQVYGDARVYGDAQVSGNVRVYGDAQVYGDARVYGNAQLSGNAQVSGNARVSGDAWVSSVPYIQGTRHALTLCSFNQIAIGCHIYDIEYWQDKYQAIGRNEGYTEDQIAEYGRHIEYLASWAKEFQAKNDAAKGGAQ